MELMRKWAWTLGLAGTLALFGGVTLGWAFGGVEGMPQRLLVGGAVMLLLYALFDRENLGEVAQTRTFVHGSVSAVLVVLALTASVAGYALARKHDHTWDLTRERAFTLSDHSIGVLRGLDRDVEVLAFFRSDAEEQRTFRGLLDRMSEQTDRLSVQWIDPLREPRLAAEHEVTTDQGTVILRAGEATRRLDSERTEEALIEKIVLLLATEEHRICWALGHGEPDPDDEFSETGLGVVVIMLEEMNYQVTREMIPSAGIARACEALVIARPTTPWAPWEREALAAYLAEGGRVLLLLEPDGSPDLAAELDRYGLTLRPDVVLDVNPENQMMGVDDPSFVVLHGRNLLSHPITADLAAAVVLPIARSIEARSDATGLAAQPLLQTSTEAWGETSLDPEAMPSPDLGVELVGEVPVAAVVVIEDPAALEVARHEPLPAGADPMDPTIALGRAVPADFAPKAGGRLVVVGDAGFPANGYVQLGNNRDLFLNAIAWLVEEEDQIGERPDAGETLAIDELSSAFLCLLSVVFVPGAVAGLALVTWVRRRNL